MLLGRNGSIVASANMKKIDALALWSSTARSMKAENGPARHGRVIQKPLRRDRITWHAISLGQIQRRETA
jgi:hypothetical protein